MTGPSGGPRQLEAHQLQVGYRDRTVIESLDLVIPPAKVAAIVGPNACGKSTLLRSLSRLLTPRRGRVLLDGQEIHRMRAKELARILGLLPQSPISPEGITAGDLVGRGRHPHQSIWSRCSHEDDMAVAAALAATDTADLVDRPVDELSGGQRQRVWIAMALAQDTDVSYSTKWGPERVDAACARALEVDAVNVALIGRMLERGTENTTLQAALPGTVVAGRFARDPDHFAVRAAGGGR